MVKSLFITRILVFLWVVFPSAVLAQAGGFTSLIADNISYNQATNQLVARGNVLITFDEIRLEAQSLVYDSATNRVTATGPIRLIDGSGTVFIADMAELSSDLREGIIYGARLLLANQFQISAAEVRRNAGRFNTLYNVAGSSCQVCLNRPVPMWQIRSSRIIHDTQEKVFYFENARFEAFGLPIVYLPRLRMYEPSVTRATGLLAPSFVSSNILGYGLKLPFFVKLGEFSDATITPYLTAGGAFLLEGEYRQRFHNGAIDVHGAFALSDGTGDFGKAFLDADMVLDFANGYTLFADLNLTNDDGFMRRFGFDKADRLVSEIGLRRFSSNGYLVAQAIYFQSLRDDEVDAEIPFALPEITYRKSWSDSLIGGRVGVGLNTTGLFRQTGRDTFRVTGTADWRRDWNAPLGIRASTFANAQIDLYRVWDDPGFSNDLLFRATPTVGLELSLPMVRQAKNGVQHVLNPVAQLIYTPNFSFNDIVPNEDSQQIEFDETNLFSFNRFPGYDKIETGARVNVGASYRRYDPTGWTLGIDVGQVFRLAPNNQFSDGSGLAGERSDLLAAVYFELPPKMRMVNRVLLGGGFEFRRAESEILLDFDRFQASGAYVYLAPDVAADSPDARSEINIAGNYQFLPNWQVNLEWRRDLIDNTDIFALFGLTYGNECVEIDVSVSRRFTNSINVPAETSIDLSVRLAGFGGGLHNRWAAQSCVQMR